MGKLGKASTEGLLLSPISVLPRQKLPNEGQSGDQADEIKPAADQPFLP